jgi:hypothetical protein
VDCTSSMGAPSPDSQTSPRSNNGFETSTLKTSTIWPVVEPTNLWNSVSGCRRSTVCRTKSYQRRTTSSRLLNRYKWKEAFTQMHF